MLNLSKSHFLINVSCYELSFYKFSSIRSCVGYLIFHLLSPLQQRNFFLTFPVSMFHFYCHYYFHYVYLWEYKIPPLGSGQASTNNQINTTHAHNLTMDHFLNILEEKQPEKIIDETKLRYIALQISIWDFFGIPQADYLAFSMDKKWRMFSEYYKKLVLKYFGGKNISFFLSEIVWKLFEIDWNVSCFWFLIWLFLALVFRSKETKSI